MIGGEENLDDRINFSDDGGQADESHDYDEVPDGEEETAEEVSADNSDVSQNGMYVECSFVNNCL